MARPRIALVHSIPAFGAIERYLQALIAKIDRRRLDLWLVVPDHPALAPLLGMEEVTGRVAAVPSPAAQPTGLHAALAYRAALREIRPDLVHSIEVDAPAMIAARLAGVRRLVVTHHTPEHRPKDSRRGRLLRRLAWEMRPHVIFTSEADRETGLRLDPIRRGRSSVISLGIELERFSPATPDRLRAELRLRDERVVGTVGLLRPQKGHDHLIRAAAQVVREEPDVVFVVVGDGELRDELRRQVQEQGLGGRFFLLGQRDDVPHLLSGFDVFALSSNYEGLCLAVAEAMAMEKPVVATAVGGVRESIVPAETGLLVPPGDPDALAEAILRLLRDPEEARRLALAAGERARRLYSLDPMIEATTALYRRLLALSA